MGALDRDAKPVWLPEFVWDLEPVWDLELACVPELAEVPEPFEVLERAGVLEAAELVRFDAALVLGIQWNFYDEEMVYYRKLPSIGILGSYKVKVCHMIFLLSAGVCVIIVDFFTQASLLFGMDGVWPVLGNLAFFFRAWDRSASSMECDFWRVSSVLANWLRRA